MPYASVNGVDLCYEETGRGFPVLFAHEYAGDQRSWAEQVRYFSKTYRCVTYNARGFPPSAAPEPLDAYSADMAVEDLAALLRHLGIDKAHIVGLSMGSMTALLFGLRHPGMAHSLVVAGTGPGETRRAKEKFEAEIEALIHAVESKGWRQMAQEFASADDRRQLRAKNPGAHEDFLRHLSERQLNGSIQVLRRVVSGRPLLADLADRLRAMTVPTLIATGDEDHVCVETSLFLKRVLPAAGLRIFPKAGHAINLEEPERFNQSLEDFFTAVEAGQWGETPGASRRRY